MNYRNLFSIKKKGDRESGWLVLFVFLFVYFELKEFCAHQEGEQLFDIWISSEFLCFLSLISLNL